MNFGVTQELCALNLRGFPEARAMPTLAACDASSKCGSVSYLNLVGGHKMWKIHRCHGVHCSYRDADRLATIQMLVVKAASIRSHSEEQQDRQDIEWYWDSPEWYWKDDHPCNSLCRRVWTGVFYIYITSQDDLLHWFVSSETNCLNNEDKDEDVKPSKAQDVCTSSMGWWLEYWWRHQSLSNPDYSIHPLYKSCFQ